MQASAESLAAFDRALFDACARLRPPEKLDCAEWADKYGMLPPEGASMPGKYFISNAEYQREPLRMLSDPRFQTVILMWSSQVGKTQIGLFGCAYYAQHDPSPQLVVQPTEDMAKAVAVDRISTMVRDTPILREIFGRGDTFHMPYPGGQISMAWANSPATLASRPIRFLWTDEPGRYSANAEGNAVDQGRKRLATFKGNRKHLSTSSPALRKTCLITKDFADSDQREYFVPCPACDHMQTLRWEQMRWEPGQPATARYLCEACEHPIQDSDKYSMVLRGEWRAQSAIGGKDGKTAGYHLNALYSTIGFDWSEVVAEFEKCQGVPDKLQVFQNTLLGLPWDEQAEGADLNEIQRHAEDYPAQAPAWVLLATCGTDVQKDRIEATKWGYGLDDVSGMLEHRVFYGDTNVAGEGAWREFTAWRRQPLLHELGVTVPIARTIIDSGDGNRTAAVYTYCRRYRNEHVFAGKGSSIHGAPVYKISRVREQGIPLIMVGSSTVKDVLYSRLRIAAKDRPGYIHFPLHESSGADSDFYAHLTAEALETTRTRAGEVSRWVKQRPRNEALDCAVYAFAAKEFARAPLRDLKRQLETKAAKVPPEVLEAQRLAWCAEAVLAPQLRGLGLLPSPASSAASPSPAHNLRPIQPKKKQKRVFRPNAAWIGSMHAASVKLSAVSMDEVVEYLIGCRDQVASADAIADHFVAERPAVDLAMRLLSESGRVAEILPGVWHLE